MNSNSNSNSNSHRGTTDLVTVLVDVSDRYDACVITIGDRVIVEQLTHQGEPLLGFGVTIHSGGFTGKRGLGQCPTLGKNTAVLSVSGVPRTSALAAGWTGDALSPVMTAAWQGVVETKHAAAAMA
jgi:hypothetical protein